MADYQILFNSAFAALLLIIGWIMRAMFETLRDLRRKDQDIYDKVSTLAVQIPEKYVLKTEMSKLVDRLFDKLDRIENKIDTKADK